MSRRRLLKSGAAAGLAAAIGGIGAGSVAASAAKPSRPEIVAGYAPGDDAPDIVLINGRIQTMDANDSTVKSLAIKNGKITAVGNGVPAGGPGSKVINLKGRTVIPGLIEGHVHIVSLANRPGYHVVIEDAGSIAGIQQMLAARRAGGVPEGEFITAMGGWHPNMFAERRLPTLAELDEAVPDRPVFIYQGGSGPSRTNTLGKQFFENVSDALAGPVVVGDDGAIATGNPNMSNRALYHLRVRQTFEDRKRTAIDTMAHSASIGLTAHLDQVLPPSNGPLSPTQGLPSLNQFKIYDPWLAVHREGKSLVRLQTNFLHNENAIELTELRERLKNTFPLFGDDMLMTGAIGEWGAPGDGNGAVWLEAQRVIAEAGWRNTNRNLSLTSLQNELNGYELIASEGHDIAAMRWTLHHLNAATEAELARCKALGVGIQAGAWRYGSGTGTAAGAPFALILDSGVQSGIHVDGVHIAPLNAWYGIYYASTGANALGDIINVGQQISRRQAVRWFTRDNAWHLSMEDRIGSLEVGKLADLLVLNADYEAVTDEELKRVHPVLTLVGGKVVHDEGVL
jgi:hypothetical protein